MENTKIKLISEPSKGCVGIQSYNNSIFNKVEFRLMLNVALMAQFGLGPNYCSEGGLSGHHVRIINDNRYTIGLRKDPELSRGVSRYEKEILAWYQELLKILFLEGALCCVLPEPLWHEPKFKDAHGERLRLFESAIIHSDWRSFNKPCETDKRIEFMEVTFTQKMKKVFTDILSAEEILPFGERKKFLAIKNIYRF